MPEALHPVRAEAVSGGENWIFKNGEGEQEEMQMSIYQAMADFLNGASILETRQELMRLGWSAKKANEWLLKAMRSNGDAMPARSGDSEINVMQAVLPHGLPKEEWAQGSRNTAWTVCAALRGGRRDDVRRDRQAAGMLKGGGANVLQPRDSQVEAQASVAKPS